MEPNKPTITDELLDVASMASTVPDREDELLRRGFAALDDALPSTLAAFLETEGDDLVVRAATGSAARPEMVRRRIALEQVVRLRELLGTRDCHLPGDRELLEELSGALGDPDLFSGPGETLLVPVAAGDDPIGLLLFHSPDSGTYGPELQRVARLCGSLIGLGILATRQADEVERYRDVLEERNRILLEEVDAETDACQALERCGSRVMRRLVRMSKQVAVTDAPVLITGETGTGKEVVARAVHAWSNRAEQPFVQLNCAALPENLVESELFGHRKGAFSGADNDRPGRFRVADGGTLLLDEVGDLPAAMQAKLLRVLQEGRFEPVGDDRTVEADVRVIAATNVDLELAVDEGRFREDLFYRLHVFPLTVPPLRERIEDLECLVAHILERAGRRTGRGPWAVTPAALKRMARYEWPGNVRELVNTLERARVLAPAGGDLDVQLPKKTGRRRRRSGKWIPLKEYERDYIEQVLMATRGKIYGTDGAAAILGLPPTTLQSRMRRHGLLSDQFK